MTDSDTYKQRYQAIKNVFTPANLQLEPGTRKYKAYTDSRGNEHPEREVQYARTFNIPPGYKELTKIVSGLQKDVKRIDSALTLGGAQKYAEKHGTNWSAHEMDFMNQNGEPTPDGINEVFVLDGDGNLKVINGYRLVNPGTNRLSKRAYYTLKELGHDNTAIQNMKYSDFTKKIKKISPKLNNEGIPHYHYGLDETGLSEAYAPLQPSITPQDLYKSGIFDAVYGGIRDKFKASYIASVPKELKGIVLAQTYSKAFRECYSEIETSALMNLQVPTDNKKLVKSFTSKNGANHDAFIQQCINIVSEMLTVKEKFDENLMYIMESIVNKGNEVLAHYRIANARFEPLLVNQQDPSNNELTYDLWTREDNSMPASFLAEDDTPTEISMNSAI